MYELIDISMVPHPSSPDLMDAYEQYMNTKDEIFIGMDIPVEEYQPIIYNREEAARNLAILMSLDVGPMESVTIVGNSRVWHAAGPREIVDWLREGF